MHRKYEPPKETDSDLPTKIIRSVAGLVPIAGSALQEFMTSPLEIRRQRWMDVVAHGLHKLEEKVGNLDPEALVHDEVFLTAILHASQTAIRNHNSAKWKALRNAVLNVAAKNDLAEERQLIFFHLLNDLTPLHLRILLRFERQSAISCGGTAVDEENWHESTFGKSVIEREFPELVDQSDLYRHIVHNLTQQGLLKLDLSSGRRGLVQVGATAMGLEFLEFIKSPISDEEIE